MKLQSLGSSVFAALIVLVIGVGAWLWWGYGMTELTVMGKATVSAVPDEYVFTPRYEERGTDQTAIRAKVTETGNNVVAALRERGVQDAMMKADVSVSQDYVIPVTGQSNTANEYVAVYTLTVKLNDVELAKNVLDVFKATAVVGDVTPQITFSDEKQRELERQARKQALDDARTQAEDMSSSLGLHLRGVESVGEPTWGGWPYAVTSSSEERSVAPFSGMSIATPELLGGEQEVSYQIEVTYRMR